MVKGVKMFFCFFVVLEYMVLNLVNLGNIIERLFCVGIVVGI